MKDSLHVSGKPDRGRYAKPQLTDDLVSVDKDLANDHGIISILVVSWSSFFLQCHVMPRVSYPVEGNLSGSQGAPGSQLRNHLRNANKQGKVLSLSLQVC